MNPRLGGALLVAAALAAAGGRFLELLFVAATVLWLLSLRRMDRAGLFWVLAVATLIRVPFAFADYFTNDLYRYVWEGTIQWEGFSPYAHSPLDPALAHLRDADHYRINHPEFATIYPPLAQMLFAGLARLGLQEHGFRVVFLLLDIAVVALVAGWLRAAAKPAGRAILYAWCPLAACAAGTGHVDPLMLALVAGTGWAWEAGRLRTAGVLLGGAILAKTVALLLLPWLALRRPRLLAWTAGVVLLGYLPYASGDLFGVLFAFGEQFAFNASLFRLIAAIAPGAAHAIAGALLVAWVGAVALTQPRFAGAWALTTAGLLFLSPTVHFWYLTWFLVALPRVGLRRWSVPLLGWCASVLFVAETYSAHFGGEPFRERFLWTGVEYAVPALLAAWALWRGWPRCVPPARPEPALPGSFAVVVPCRGEARNLRALLPRWLAAGAARVVVADTPTGDGTRELTAADERLCYVEVKRRGYGAAVAAGLAEVGEVEFAVVCDADHLLGPEQVGALLAPFAEPAVGLVTAARGGGRGLSLPQRTGNALATFLIGVGWGRRFHDLGPFRALRVAAWPDGSLTDPGFGWNVEMNVRALEQRTGVVEVALPPSVREHGEDKISGTLRGVAGAGWGMLSRLYRLREESCRRPSSS